MKEKKNHRNIREKFNDIYSYISRNCTRRLLFVMNCRLISTTNRKFINHNVKDKNLSVLHRSFDIE